MSSSKGQNYNQFITLEDFKYKIFSLFLTGKPMQGEIISSELDLWKEKYLQVLQQDRSQNNIAQNENLLPG